MMRVTLDLSGPKWLWSVLLFALGVAYATKAVMEARLAYWRHRLNQQRESGR